VAASNNSTIEHGELVRQWKWPLRLAFWWITIALFVWIFTLCIQGYWAYRDTAAASRVDHAQRVLEQEVRSLAALQPGVFEPLEVARRISKGIHGTMVTAATTVARAIMNWPSFMRRNASGATMRSQADPGGDFIAAQMAAGGEVWQLIETNTALFAVRTATYLCALPLAALMLSFAAVDGLVARSKRKACGGRESAGLYHRAKVAQSFLAIMAYVVYLALPSVPGPAAVLVPAVALLAFLMRVQCAYYKKYL
jgi:integrating conjugative element membrane protein (TIGR03747 family)